MGNTRGNLVEISNVLREIGMDLLQGTQWEGGCSNACEWYMQHVWIVVTLCQSPSCLPSTSNYLVTHWASKTTVLESYDIVSTGYTTHKTPTATRSIPNLTFKALRKSLDLTWASSVFGWSLESSLTTSALDWSIAWMSYQRKLVLYIKTQECSNAWGMRTNLMNSGQVI